MKFLKKGTKVYRGGICKNHMAFFAMNPKVARMYGRVCSYVTTRPIKLFTISHDSLKKVFKYISSDVRLLLSFVFGTGIKIMNQELTLKKLMIKKSPIIKKLHARGERLSVTEIDSIAMASFAKEFLDKRGYDGVYMPKKKSRFHKGVFHDELYISKRGVLKNASLPSSVSPQRGQPSYSIRKTNLTRLFLDYTKHTKTLLKPHPSQFVIFLSGGMAVKLYLEARGIKSVETSDFDFKFAVPHVIKNIAKYSELMKRIMSRHISGFIRFLRRQGIQASVEFKEIEGVPLNKPGGSDSIKKKVYKVYNYTIITPDGKRHELVDTSLVYVPGISRKHISLKWSRKFGVPIQTLSRLWRDTLYVLAGSFVVDTIKLRNPINGAKKEKGIKDAIRAGHLSFLIARRKKLKTLVNLSRTLILDIISRNKNLGTIHSKKIMSKIKHFQYLNLRQHSQGLGQVPSRG